MTTFMLSSIYLLYCLVEYILLHLDKIYRFYVINKILVIIIISDIMVQRVTYRRRLSYNTASNQVKKVKTPGGKLVLQYVKKRGTLPKCPMTGQRLRGIKKVK